MAKERVLEEAFKLFGLYGIKGVTMDDIAKHLGMSKRTIYEIFKDKNNLLEECLSQEVRKSLNEFDDFLNATNNVLQSILLHIKRKKEPESKCKIRLLLDIQRFYPQIYKKHQETIGKINTVKFEEVIIQGIKQGMFREDIDPKIVAFLFSEQANCFFAEQQERLVLDNNVLQELNIIEVFENLFLNFLRGISTSKGIQIIEEFNK